MNIDAELLMALKNLVEANYRTAYNAREDAKVVISKAEGRKYDRHPLDLTFEEASAAIRTSRAIKGNNEEAGK